MDGKITSLPPLTNVDRAADFIEVVDTSAGSSTRATVNDLLGLSSEPLGRLEVQTVRNKIFDASNSFILATGNSFFADSTDPTKQLGFDLSNQSTGTRRTFRVPSGNGTLVDTATAQAIDSKTFTNATLVSPTINNPILNVNAINEFTTNNGVTVGGVNMKTGKVSTPDAVDTAAIKDAAVSPNKLVAGAGSGWDWQVWNPTFTNLSVGNGTLTARYVQIGKMVWINFVLRFNNTSSANGDISMTLPVPASNLYTTVSENVIIGGGIIAAVRIGGTDGAARTAAPFFNGSNGTIHLGYIASGSNNFLSSSADISFTNANPYAIIQFYGFYEAA